MKTKCGFCGHRWRQRPSLHRGKQGQRCPKCKRVINPPAWELDFYPPSSREVRTRTGRSLPLRWQKGREDLI
jgi:tRNA(Ile2) C34 agmatinyltransferase TiaS